MEKEFVNYNQAVKLKELGFDEPCFAFYLAGGIRFKQYKDSQIRNSSFFNKTVCSVPTFSQAFRWFREKYDWQHSIDPTADQHSHKLGYNYWIWNYKTGEEHHTMPKNRPSGDWQYETYEEAELACLDKLIELTFKSE